MPAPKIEQGDKVRFTYTAPGNTRPNTLEGAIISFIFKTQKAIIEVKGVGALTVPISDIIRKLDK